MGRFEKLAQSSLNFGMASQPFQPPDLDPSQGQSEVKIFANAYSTLQESRLDSESVDFQIDSFPPEVPEFT